MRFCLSTINCAKLDMLMDKNQKVKNDIQSRISHLSIIFVPNGLRVERFMTPKIVIKKTTTVINNTLQQNQDLKIFLNAKENNFDLTIQSINNSK